ncbi:MAG: amino acid adenylation domain-containing protein, partial [Neisseriaceae bacterium]
MYKIQLSPYHNIFYREWQLDPLSSKYNIVFDQTLANVLDIRKLSYALEQLIAEHFILNSHVINVEGVPYWKNNRKIRYLEVFDDIENKEKTYQYVSKPFDLEGEPLYRFAIFRDVDLNYRFILVFHHLIIDGSSFDELISEISKYYNKNNYSCKVSIADQIQSASSTTNKVYELLNLHQDQCNQFWTSRLSNLEVLDLTFIKSRGSNLPKTTKTIIKEFNFCFTEKVIDQIEKVQNKYGISAFAYGQIVFAILLNRYTSQTKFGICYPIKIKEFSGLNFGAGINTAVIPYFIENNTKVLDLIYQYKDFVNDLKSDNCFNYGYYPVNEFVRNLNKGLLNISFSQTNLKNKIFNFERVDVIKVNNDFNIDLTNKFLFEQELQNNSLNYRVKYSSLEIDEIILSYFINHFKKIFIDILFDLSQGNDSNLVIDYQLLSTNEYNKLVYEWNNTAKPYPTNKTICELFEEQVLKTPDNIALVYESTKLTYNELNCKSNRLAHYIKDNYSIQSDDLIALCLERSEQMIIAILAVLKTGGAYVPIDSNNPIERIKYILEDSNAKVLIINGNVEKNILSNVNYKNTHSLENNSLFKCDIIIVDKSEIQNKLEEKSDKNLMIKQCLEQLAYVIYTSGTTGMPKGVMIENRSAINYITYLINSYQIDNSTISSQYAGFGFDALVIEIYPILLSGGRLCIINEVDKLDLNNISEFFLEQEINYAFMPPQIAQLFSIIGKNKLKNLIVGGDKFYKFTKQNYRLINAYGPTEITVQSHGFVVDKFYENTPIGKPIANVTSYILDSCLNPMPIGAIGELFVGGDGVARGYINKEKLTAERFIPNPFQTEEEKKQGRNSRLYKTGDLCRYLPDGNAEFIGRNDSQVKIRGYRVEVGDIEAHLCKYPEIKQAVVIVEENAGISNDDSSVKVIPLNITTNSFCDASEKILYSNSRLYNEQDNLGLLPIQEWFFKKDFTNINHWNQSFLIKTPRLEKKLLLISFLNLLKYHDNFRIRYRRKFGSNLAYEPYYIDNLFEKYDFYNISQAQLQDIRKTINFKELDISKIFYKEDTVEFNESLSQILTSWQSNFDIENGFLYCFGYIHGYSDGSCRIYVALHHLIIDVVSWHIILNDLYKIYSNLSLHKKDDGVSEQDNNLGLSERNSTSYQQWVNIVKKYAIENINEKDYWRNVLLGYEEFDKQLNKLVKNYSCTDTINNRNKTDTQLILDKKHTFELINKSKLINSKVNEMLLATIAFSLKELLIKYTSGSLDFIYITLEGHGREHIDPNADITHTIGWFTTMYPIRMTVNKNIRDLLKDTKKILQDIPNNGIGYGALFGYAKSLPCISFNYLGQIDYVSENHWTITGEDSGLNIAHENKPYNVVDIVCYIVNGTLAFDVVSQLNQTILNEFMQIIKTSLIALIDSLKQMSSSNYGSLVKNGYGKAKKEYLYGIENQHKDDLTQNLTLSQFNTNIDYNYNIFKKYLVAYYVSDTKLDQNLIIEHLSNYLPAYLIPHKFIWLEKIPLTLNGKIDIKVLPRLDDINNHNYVAPRDEKEALVCQAFATVLPKNKVSIYDDFFRSGGDSISAITLVMLMQHNFNVTIGDIYTYKTPCKIAHNIAFSNDSIKQRLLRVLQEIKGQDTISQKNTNLISEDIEYYMSSAKSLCPDISCKKIKNVLLTGATGYLGCNILNQLLTCTDYNVYVLVRAESNQVAIKRMNDKYQLYFSEFLYEVSVKNPRVFILSADIEKSELGLSKDEYVNLVNNIDSVIHAATLVKQFGDEDIFYRANVLATINLLEFTNLTKSKDFHYISTISVLKHNSESYNKWNNYYTEELLPDELQYSDNNIYLKTKLEAEKQVVKYRDYGINANIYRVGNLTFMLKNMTVQENVGTVILNYWLTYLLKFKQIFEGIKINISPVDLTANAITKLFDKKCTHNCIYHVYNPNMFDLDNYV